jgi:hypothetical protein
MIIKIFSPKQLAKNNGVFVQNTARFFKMWIVTLGFKKSAIFSPKIGKKHRKL